MKETASCLCGAVTIETTGQPDRVGLCHCMTCRKETGSAFNYFVVFPSTAVRITGETASWSVPGGDARHFCPTCGSLLFYIAADSAEIEVSGGAFDAPNLFAPSYECWAIRREHWLGDTGLHRYAENRIE